MCLRIQQQQQHWKQAGTGDTCESIMEHLVRLGVIKEKKMEEEASYTTAGSHETHHQQLCVCVCALSPDRRSLIE